MEDYLKKYYDETKELLILGNSNVMDDDELTMEAHFLEQKIDYELDKKRTSIDCELEGEDAIWGLFSKLRRLHGERAQINRSFETPLSSYPVERYEPPKPECPYCDDDTPEIQKRIIGYINNRARNSSENDLYPEPLLSDLHKIEISTDKLMVIAGNLKTVSHAIIDFINHYEIGTWNWGYDCEFIAQYIFEKSVELTYYIFKGIPIENLSYDCDEIFTYFQTRIPELLQERVDSVVDKLQDIVIDTTWFIRQNKYHLCDKEAWLRPLIYTIGSLGMWFTLEQEI